MDITVFMPVYNAERYLRKSIDSILNQEYKDFELLIVDDGSTDGSIDIILSYDDSRIRLIQNERNMGIPYTRNVGLDNARGKYIAIMDSDDIAKSNRLTEQVNYLEKNINIGVVTSSYHVMRKNITIRRVMKKNNNEFIKAYLLFDSYICNPSTMIRSSLREFARYNEKCFVCQDFDFWIQLINITNFGSIEKPLLKYRTGHMNITQKTNKTKQKKRKEILHDIRRASLEKRGFLLDHEELNIVNEFMDFNNDDIKKIINFKEVLIKLIKINKINKQFENSIFNEVIKSILEKQFNMCKINILEKLRVRKLLIENTDLKISRFIIINGQIINNIKKYNLF